MKKAKKITIITAAIVAAVGLICVFGGVIGMGFNFGNFNSSSAVTNTYKVEDAFKSILIDDSESDIELYPSEDGKCKVVCDESEKITHTVSVENGTLTVKRQDNRRWFEYFGFFLTNMKVSVYLPQDKYEDLCATTLSGNVSVGKEFSFNTARAESTSGDVRFKADVKEELSAKSTSGEVYIENTAPQSLTAKSTSGNVRISGVKSADTLRANSVSGNIKLTDVVCSDLTAGTTSGEVSLMNTVAGKAMSLESTSGEIELDRCDAQSLWLKTISGGISGTLLSEKQFVTKTTSGSVNVPDCSSGGRCEASTVSGNIEFKIA